MIVVDVAVVEGHGAIIDIHAAPLQSNDEIVKSKHPIDGMYGWGRKRATYIALRARESKHFVSKSEHPIDGEAG